MKQPEMDISEQLEFERRMREAEARLGSHEAVCLVRYDAINARLKRIEKMLMGSAAFIIALLLGLVLKLPL